MPAQGAERVSFGPTWTRDDHVSKVATSCITQATTAGPASKAAASCHSDMERIKLTVITTVPMTATVSPSGSTQRGRQVSSDRILARSFVPQASHSGDHLRSRGARIVSC